MTRIGAARWRGTRQGSLPVLLCLGGVILIVHGLTDGAYGYFRDELYYIACSNHLAAGYVDHAPLSILLLAVERRVLGDSLHAIRFLPALAGAVLVVLTGLTTRALGGSRFAQALAAVAVMAAPVYLALGDFYSMNAFEPLFWTLAAYLLIRIVQAGSHTDRSALWLPFGIVVGLGIENKHSMLFFAAGVGVALLLTPQRRALRDPWLWAGAAAAAALFAPNLWWQATHGWATLEFLHNAQAYKNAALPPGPFLAQQVLMLHPLTLPLWLAGLFSYLVAPSGRPYRLLGWTYVVILAVFLLTNAKPYYLAPAYPMLFAAGAPAADGFITRRAWGWLRPASVALLVLGGLVTAPTVLPVLPPATLVRYARALHLDAGTKQATAERTVLGELPQYFADMFGWRTLVAAVARAYGSLPPAARARCAIYAQNYGEAGAIDFFGKAYHLPPALSGHNTYWLWGPRGYDGDLVIVVGGSAARLKAAFASVTQVGATHCRYCMPHEDGVPIYLCRHAKQPIGRVWPRLKHYL